MGTRRLSREFVLQYLYACDINNSYQIKDLEAFWGLFIEVHHLSDSVREDQVVTSFINNLLRAVIKHLEEIDCTIRKYATNWDFTRITLIDRNIIRIALAEMVYLEDIPAVVSIDEAVEIAKKYSTPDSGKFVNGVLDKIKQDTITAE